MNQLREESDLKMQGKSKEMVQVRDELTEKIDNTQRDADKEKRQKIQIMEDLKQIAQEFNEYKSMNIIKVEKLVN